MNALSLLKERLGIKTARRDDFLKALIKSVEEELNSVHGISLDENSMHELLFLVDYSAYYYLQNDSKQSTNRGSSTPVSMPRSLQFRLHNLIIKRGAMNE